MSADVLHQFVIYRNPADYPDKVVVRRWSIGAARPLHDAALGVAVNRRVPLPPLCDDCRRARERAVALSLYAPYLSPLGVCVCQDGPEVPPVHVRGFVVRWGWS